MFHFLKTDAEFRQALEETQKFPDFMLVHYTIENWVLKRFPEFELNIFSYDLPGGGKLWIVVSINVGNRLYIIFGVDQNSGLNYEDFKHAYDGVISSLPGLYENMPKSFLFEGVDQIFELYQKYMAERYPHIKIEKEECNFFYANENQMEYLKNLHIVLPEGYEFDKLDMEKDLKTISNSWQYGVPGEIERTRAKLTWLPYSLIREKSSGKPIAYELVDPCGFLNHQYTCPDHRGKGLGNAVEQDVSRKCIEFGIIPNKAMSTTNKLLEASKRCPYWTIWEHDGKPVVWIFGIH